MKIPHLDTTPHEITDVCMPYHCYGHDIDEHPRTTYQACGECFHVYPTARALRRAYAAGHREIIRADWRKPRKPVIHSAWPAVRLEADGTLVADDTVDPARKPWMTRPTRLALAWAWLTAGLMRTRTIYFCPTCLHDF